MRRLPTTELIDPGAGASFVARRSQAGHGWPFAWHRHPEWELTLIVDGAGVRFVGDGVEDFAAGDLCLIPPDLPHTWMSRPLRLSESIVVQMPPAFMSGLGALPEGAALRRLCQRAGLGLRFAGHQAELELGRLVEAEGLTRCGLLLGLLDRLSRLAAQPLASCATPPAGAADRRLARALALVERSRQHGVAQRRAAAEAGMSPAAFSRFFRRATGRTFVEHVARRRIAAVCRDLAETDDRVLDIALRHGWQGLAAFNRRFRAVTGSTPSAWRRTSAARPGG